MSFQPTNRVGAKYTKFAVSLGQAGCSFSILRVALACFGNRIDKRARLKLNQKGKPNRSFYAAHESPNSRYCNLSAGGQTGKRRFFYVSRMPPRLQPATLVNSARLHPNARCLLTVQCRQLWRQVGHKPQTQSMAPIDLISCLVADELSRHSDRLLEWRKKQAQFRDPHKTLDNFNFQFNKNLNCSLVFDLAAIQQGYRVLYRETHMLIDEIAEATIDGSRNQHMELLATVPLLIIDDRGMRKLLATAAEDLLKIVMRRAISGPAP